MKTPDLIAAGLILATLGLILLIAHLQRKPEECRPKVQVEKSAEWNWPERPRNFSDSRRDYPIDRVRVGVRR